VQALAQSRKGKAMNAKKKIVFKKAAKKIVVDFEKSAVRMAAREALAENPISIEKGADVLAVRILEEKRKYYALKGLALSKAERATCMKKNAKAIKAQHSLLYSLIKAGNWASLDEVKMYTRAKGLFDARLIDGKIVAKAK
jgi:hypothetical protein